MSKGLIFLRFHEPTFGTNTELLTPENFCITVLNKGGGSAPFDKV